MAESRLGSGTLGERASVYKTATSAVLIDEGFLVPALAILAGLGLSALSVYLDYRRHGPAQAEGRRRGELRALMAGILLLAAGVALHHGWREAGVRWATAAYLPFLAGVATVVLYLLRRLGPAGGGRDG